MIAQSYGGGDTGRILPSKKKGKNAGKTADEFVAYARFLEESVHGYSPFGFRAENEKSKALAPRFINGRYVSPSPEHTLIRVGGDGQRCGAGGSGVGRYSQVVFFLISLQTTGLTSQTLYTFLRLAFAKLRVALVKRANWVTGDERTRNRRSCLWDVSVMEFESFRSPLAAVLYALRILCFLHPMGEFYHAVQDIMVPWVTAIQPLNSFLMFCDLSTSRLSHR